MGPMTVQFGLQAKGILHEVTYRSLADYQKDSSRRRSSTQTPR